MGIFISNLLTTGKRVLDPTSIRGCSLWLDANAGLFNATSGGSAVSVNGNTIARWEDQSGNARHFTQSAAIFRPVLTTSAQNGLNSISFSSSYLTGGNICSLDTNNLYVALISKFNSSATTDYDTILARNGGYVAATAGYYSVSRWDMNVIAPPDSSGKFMLRVNNGSTYDVGTANYTDTNYTYNLFSFPRNSTRAFNAEVTINDVLKATTVVPQDTQNLATNHNLVIGCNVRITSLTYAVDPNTYLNGDICELAIFQRSDALTSRELTGLSRYFRNKWAI